MFLFILESIGTSELILIGIVALVFLGPRKLPEIARKAGKIMTEFRGTASEFKETWQREVNFEEEAKSFTLSDLDADDDDGDNKNEKNGNTANIPEAPAIKAVDPERFKNLIPTATETVDKAESVEESGKSDKKHWL